MDYDVASVASDLMVDIEDLQVIYDSFFKEANVQIKELAVIAANDQNDSFEKMAKLSHSLKGAAYNLRMKELGDLCFCLELSAKQNNRSIVPTKTAELENKFQQIKLQVDRFFNQLPAKR